MAWTFAVAPALYASITGLRTRSAPRRIAYSVHVPWDHVPAILVTLAIGAASFCALGAALTAAIPSLDAAPAITNLAVLPLYFLSGVFIPEDQIPNGVLDFADAFPVRHFFEAFFSVYEPAGAGGAGMQWGHLAVVAAWGLAGALLAVRFFRWTPKEG